jgi:hypothetical protein
MWSGGSYRPAFAAGELPAFDPPMPDGFADEEVFAIEPADGSYTFTLRSENSIL